MMNFSIKFILVIFNCIFFNGCVFTNHFVQQATINSLSSHSPVSVTYNKKNSPPIIKFHVSNNIQPNTSFNNSNHTNVNSAGEFVYTSVSDDDWDIPDTSENIYPFQGNNIFLKTPNFEMNGHIDFPLFDHFSIQMGYGLGFNEQNKYSKFGYGGNIFFEFDNFALNGEIYNIRGNNNYYALLVQQKSQIIFNKELKTKIIEIDTIGISHETLLSTTLNTCFPKNKINYYIRYGGGSTWLNLKKTDLELRILMNFTNINIGVFRQISKHNRLLFGLDNIIYNKENISRNRVGSYIQFDFIL
ncbi:MAG: hypothetical protein HOB40_04240 [Candidatus Marinimicrobia bacterium]|jgi:hypothetical protein|nr:hypothetical protein [Candidatus Neomarinimicrobiota bacterium]MBT3999734.1 hypothetical protein [Candidatus Neomarinimicrobiota bacterium]MBT4578603.1 hypothetical protein [Candidatus Neomarinimicrobiota bacterium]MBT4957010.1 hypothetical protein [Candidatus Neomarinimicrobiota bacterium]MBT5462064.1 hypothetical protein [Candidatus Neomarinimicrobiota bacterium]